MSAVARPVSALAVESWLRSLSTPEQIEAGGTYPYLFGMATVKLAEAHAEIRQLRETLDRCAELLDDYSDVSDGDDGPRPNRAMSLLRDVESVLRVRA